MTVYINANEQVSTAPENAARSGPNTSTGIIWMLLTTARQAKKLTAIAAAASVVDGTNGTAAVTTSTGAIDQQTRSLVLTESPPCRRPRKASHPPKNPPSVANTGGIQANCWFACTSVRWRSSTK